MRYKKIDDVKAVQNYGKRRVISLPLSLFSMCGARRNLLFVTNQGSFGGFHNVKVGGFHNVKHNI